MNKGIICLTVLLAFTIALVPVASAHPMKPLRWKEEFDFDWDLYQWIGVITEGDIEGTFVITPAIATFPGSTEHFAENKVISTTDGETITIYEEGVWSFKTFKYRIHGIVTSATGDYAYLIGAKVHGMGYTTELDLGPPPEPISGMGTCQIN